MNLNNTLILFKKSILSIKANLTKKFTNKLMKNIYRALNPSKINIKLVTNKWINILRKKNNKDGN